MRVAHGRLREIRARRVHARPVVVGKHAQRVRVQQRLQDEQQQRDERKAQPGDAMAVGGSAVHGVGILAEAAGPIKAGLVDGACPDSLAGTEAPTGGRRNGSRRASRRIAGIAIANGPHAFRSAFALIVRSRRAKA